MSKLTDHIETHRMSRVFAKPSGPIPYTELTSIESVSYEPIPHLIEYRITVTIGASIRHDTTSGKPLPVAQVARMIQHEVFGEFREDINKIHLALWEYDCDKAAELLSAMEQRMFSA